jgi:hypothetical protein
MAKAALNQLAESWRLAAGGIQRRQRKAKYRHQSAK